MARYLTVVMFPRGRNLSGFLGTMLIGAIVALPISPVSAEELPDPTRPPLLSSSDAAQIEPEKSAGLQSVIISKKRSAAIIDGQTIELGEKYGDVRLIEVSDTRVILQGAHERRVMTLFPGVSMTNINDRPGLKGEWRSGVKEKAGP